ncbi:RagB/SusD family nutrient uptake outer membrane protein [Chitinophaga pinensis]|uniref:RagB/SusD domain protein n=1 Tax=Chitinophaga pinensis (strain ATCC 43595 / DSM 2588 / LMG 13176 / NBRC 15968 / NCIMB 11800 / UQM 2034) TaxID=485918 RepID=A0A979G8I9_CHIPD|nr:RagB/SusD family nutrient uptake outer membrane protein [Chitinophaga pinensis]ACU62745.1 RagB/SusD domain protein [Chitinophaga pinensis DSM 2588]
MKRLAIILLVTGTMAASCNKLDESASSLITSSQFYKTKADAIAAVAAVYSTLNTDAAGDFPMYGRNMNLLTGNGSDDQVFSPSNTNTDVRALGTATYVPANDRIKKNWQQHYFGISRANVAIDNIPSIDFDTAQRAGLVREAKFIRGLLYFNIVRFWGDAPLILHDPTNIDVKAQQVKRSPKDSVYAQVIRDLTDATLLPKTYTGGDIGRATSGAAHAILAKVYVTRREWSKALTEINEVINGGYGYALFDKFSEVFQQATKNGKEHIFSVQFGTNLGAKNSTQSLSSGNFSSFNAAVYPGDLPADSTLFQLFAATDNRRDVTFLTRIYNAATGNYVTFSPARFGKFIDYSITPLNNQAQSGINYPVIRYADILLLKAEVLNEIAGNPTTEAYTAINAVRARASVAGLTQGLNQADFRDSVFLERRKEFIQEGNRWFDLSRRGGSYLYDALKKLPAKTGAALKDTLFPIPQAEIDINNQLTNNPGW